MSSTCCAAVDGLSGGASPASVGVGGGVGGGGLLSMAAQDRSLTLDGLLTFFAKVKIDLVGPFFFTGTRNLKKNTTTAKKKKSFPNDP